MKLGDENMPLLLAKIICIMTFFFSGRVLLETLRILPQSRSMLKAYSERHSMLLPTLSFIESSILLVAAFLLWKMSKSAFRLFLIELVISTGGSLYLTYVSPVETMVLVRQHHPSIVLGGLCFAVTIGTFPPVCESRWKT